MKKTFKMFKKVLKGGMLLFVVYVVYINTPTRIGNTGFYIYWNPVISERLELLWHNDKNRDHHTVVTEFCDEVLWNKDWIVFNTWWHGGVPLSYYIVEQHVDTGRFYNYRVFKFDTKQEWENGLKENNIDVKRLKKIFCIQAL